MAVAVRRREERRSDRSDSRPWPPTTADEHEESLSFAKTEKIQKNRIMDDVDESRPRYLSGDF